MSVCTWFGFLLCALHSLPVSTDDFYQNPSYSVAPFSLGFVVTSMFILLVSFVVYKWKQNQSKGSRRDHINTAGGDLDKGETENQTKHPEDEIDGDQEDEEQMTEEAEKEVKKEPVTNQFKDKKDEVQQLKEENHRNMEKNDEMDNHQRSADMKMMVKEQNQLKLDSRDMQIRKLNAELERFKRLKTDTVQGMREPFQQLKFIVAFRRMQKLEDSVNKIQHFKDKLWEAEYDLGILRRELEATHKQMIRQQTIYHNRSQTDVELQHIRYKLKKKTDKNNNLQKELKDKRAEIQNLQDEQQRRQEADMEINNKVAEVELKLKDEQQRREEAEKNLQTLKEELETKNKELHQCKMETESLTEKNEKQLTELRDESEQQLRDLTHEVQQLRKDNERKDDVLLTLNKQLETKKKELVKNKLAADRSWSQTVEDLKETQKKLEDMMAANRKLQNEIDDKVAAVEKEKLMREEAEKELTTLKKQLEKERNELHQTESQFEFLMEKNEEREKELTELREQYKKELENMLHDEQQRGEEVEEELETLKKELEKEQEQDSSLHLTTTKAEASELEEPQKGSDVSAAEHLTPTEQE